MNLIFHYITFTSEFQEEIWLFFAFCFFILLSVFRCLMSIEEFEKCAEYNERRHRCVFLFVLISYLYHMCEECIGLVGNRIPRQDLTK